MSNVNEATNAIIKDVCLFWAKLDKPVEPFGTLQWEIQIRFPKKRIKEMEQYGKVKETDAAGVYSINLKKKAVKKDGEPAMKVKLVDRTGQEVDSKILGNGSTGNVKVMLRDYEIRGPKGNVTKEGTQVMLVAVQVTDLIEYVPKANGADFDFDDEEPVADERIPASAKEAAVKGKPGRKPAAKVSFDEDDDIPF
jgi:hypothetical protein